MFRLTQNYQGKCCQTVAQRLGAGRFLVVILGLFAGCGLENRLIFHPTTEILRTPRDVGLHYRDLYFTTADDVRLNGWFIPHPQASATMVWFHGNAGNIGDRVNNIKLLHDRTGIGIFIFDYRGYGRSEGSSRKRQLISTAMRRLNLSYAIEQSRARIS